MVVQNENVTLGRISENIDRLYAEVKFIKHLLSEENELSEWARRELEKARKEKKTTSHEELKRELGL